LRKDLSVITRFKIAILGWAAASVFFTVVLVMSGLGHKPLGFALYSNAVHFGLWALAVPLLARVIRVFPLRDSRRFRNATVILVIAVAFAMLIVVVHWAIVFVTYFPERSSYSTFVDFLESELVRFLPFDILVGIALVVALEGWRILQAFQAERIRSNDLERRLAVSRLDALRMQLHPHFLFNTLHAIAGLITEQPQEARRMTISLGEFLRRTLQDTSGPLHTLAEELEFVDLYLSIEKVRLGERLSIRYELESGVTAGLVPSLVLQPLVENAVRHGVARIAGPCEIRFRASRASDDLLLSLENDGPKLASASAPARFGVGLTNTTARLRLHYGDGFKFQYNSRSQGGAQVTIAIPFRAAGPEQEAFQGGASDVIANAHSCTNR
jgi:two-component system, LytTR family, sensor kinase